jgi:hypothetical protein
MFLFTCDHCAFVSLVRSSNITETVAPLISFRLSSTRLQCCERVVICSSCASRAGALGERVERWTHLTPAWYSPRQAESRLAAASILYMEWLLSVRDLFVQVSQDFLVLQECSINGAWTHHQRGHVPRNCVRLHSMITVLY